MSLQVWLPLTKDLRQQGISNTVVTNSGATYSSTGGKLGGCYVFDGTDDAIGIGDLSTLVSTDFTFACWFYHDDTWSSKSWETILGGPSGFELEMKNSTTNSPCVYLYSWGKGNFTYDLNTWNHLVMTRNSTETKVYLNGELKLTGSAGTIPSGDYFVGAWKTSAQQNYKGKINDVRIYDNCLSAEEIKRISQGLILHYPLNHMGLGQENLLKGTDVLEITNNINTGVGGWDNISTLTTTDDGVKLTGRSGAPCIGLPLANTGSINNNEPYTLSFKYRTNKAMSCNFYYIESSGSNVSIYSDIATKVSTTEWQDFKWTITSSTVADRIPRAILMFYAFSSNSSDWIEIKRGSLKLEKGSIATPWSPAPNDTSYSQMGLDSNIEFDTSGFCNNGTITGTPIYTSDTPKYVVSAQFTGTQYILSESPTTNGATLAAWVKTASTSNQALVIDYKSGLGIGFWSSYIIPSCNSTIKTTYPNSAYHVNEWNHIVIVKNSSSSILCYVNGVSQTAGSTQDYWSANMADAFSIAARPNGASPSTCQVSDVRIYATALSADDVKSLYQNCATIDSNGTIYGQIRT